jgi:iron(III) transport system substrate-binding protein
MIKYILMFTVLFSAQLSASELVVYSARKEKFVKPLIKKFEKETGIKVILQSGTKAIKVLAESKKPLANIFISNDVAQMEYLRINKALYSNKLKRFNGIPSNFVSEDFSWIGISARSRVLMYNKKMIKSSDLPKKLENLTDNKYKKKFMVTRGGNESFIAHMAALRATWGEKKTLTWLKNVKNNAGAITKGHTQIRKAVGKGEFAFGLVNNYYFYLQLNQTSDNNVGLLYLDQGKDETGVFVNCAGVALIKNDKNLNNAIKFLNWLEKKENQKLFVSKSFEVPLNKEIKLSKWSKNVNEYKTMKLKLSTLGQKWSSTRKLIERSGLDLEIR